jgi:hypothetical protein
LAAFNHKTSAVAGARPSQQFQDGFEQSQSTTSRRASRIRPKPPLACRRWHARSLRHSGRSTAAIAKGRYNITECVLSTRCGRSIQRDTQGRFRGTTVVRRAVLEDWSSAENNSRLAIGLSMSKIRCNRSLSMTRQENRQQSYISTRGRYLCCSVPERIGPVLSDYESRCNISVWLPYSTR